jgi:hypothetical protein
MLLFQIKRNPIKYLILFSFFVLMSSKNDCQAIESKFKYFLIDSLNNNYKNKWLGFKFKDRNILLNFENKKMNFSTNFPDSLITRYKTLPSINSQEYSTDKFVIIYSFKFMSINNDTLCLKAKYQLFDKKKKTDVSGMKKIDNIKICKNDINGFYYDPYPWIVWVKFGFGLIIVAIALLLDENFGY